MANTEVDREHVEGLLYGDTSVLIDALALHKRKCQIASTMTDKEQLSSTQVKMEFAMKKWLLALDVESNGGLEGTKKIVLELDELLLATRKSCEENAIDCTLKTCYELVKDEIVTSETLQLVFPAQWSILKNEIAERAAMWKEEYETSRLTGRRFIGNIVEGRITHHTNEVLAVASSRDGFAFSGGGDKSLVMTDLVTGEVKCRKEKAHKDQVSKIAVAPVGSFIVTCDNGSKVLKIWDPNDNLKELAELKGHGRVVCSVGVHPNSKLIASGDWKGLVKLWEPAGLGGSWKKKKTLKDNSGSMNAVVFSPDGKWLATAGDDKKIRMYDVANNFSLKHTMEGHTANIYSLSFAPDSSTLVSGSQDESIRLWNVTEGTLLKKIDNAHTWGILSVAHSSNGSRIASGSVDKTIKI